jgi:hypothetical protein
VLSEYRGAHNAPEHSGLQPFIVGLHLVKVTGRRMQPTWRARGLRAEHRSLSQLGAGIRKMSGLRMLGCGQNVFP